MTFASVLAGLALLAAPQPASITLPAKPSIVRADGQLVAAVVPGNRRTRCAAIVLWRLGRSPRTIRTHVQCERANAVPDRITALALAGTTVAWQETSGGNNRDLAIYRASEARPRPVLVSYAENGSGAADDPGGSYNGGLAGHGGLIVYATWKECDPYGQGYARPCGGGLPDRYDATLRRIGGGVLRSGEDVLDPVWVDSGRVLIRQPINTLALLDGPDLRRVVALDELYAAAMQGRQLVTISLDELRVYDTETARLTRRFRLREGARALDVQSGIAVLGQSGTTHLIRLADGRGATFRHAANAQLEPAGLYYSSGTRLVFVPRAAVLRRFG